MHPRLGSSSSDSGLFLPAAILIGVLVVLGFGPTYFFRPFTTSKETLTALVHTHAALMTAWISLFIIQTALVATNRLHTHRILGKFGFVLLALIAIVSLPMAIVAAKLGGNHMPGPALPALALVFALLIEFITFASLGLHFRNRPDLHKRLMVLASITAMEAGVARLPVDFLHSIPRTHLATDLLLFTIIVIDTLRRGQVHPAFLWGAAYLVSMQVFSLRISETLVWQHISQGILARFY